MKLLFVLVLSIACDTAFAQNWSQAGVGVAWSSFQATTDTKRGFVYVVNSGGFKRLEGHLWVQLPPPGTNLGGNMAYDDARDVVVTVGHEMFTGTLETWEWNGTQWAMSPVTPPQLWSLCFHSGLGKLIGLSRASTWANFELLQWDGVAWLPISSPNSLPYYREFGRLAYDSGRDRLVGMAPVVHGQPTNETWEWDQVNGWVQVVFPGPNVLPSGGFALTYDASRAVQVAITATGGLNSIATLYERQGSGPWVQKYTGSLVGPPGALAHDPNRNRDIYLDRNGLAWSWSLVNPAYYALHGPGCTGSAGEPRLELADPAAVPWVGSTMQFQVRNLPAGLALLVTGFQDQGYGATPLPFDLVGYGAPGCLVRVAPDATLLLAGTGGVVQGSLSIPNTFPMLGVRFYQQALSIDPSQNALGLVTSNSRLARVGQPW